MLAWEKPWCEPFRNLLVHPNVKPYLEEALGKKYRLDHGPGLIGYGKREQKVEPYTAAGLSVLISPKLTFFKYGRIYTGLNRRRIHAR